MIINLTSREIEAIAALVEEDIDKAIREAIEEEALGKLVRFNLLECGEFLITQLGNFEKEIRELRSWKSPGKKSDAKDRARKSGRRLSDAVSDMKGRAAKESKQRERFFIEDTWVTSRQDGNKIQVTIPFRWRASDVGEWKRDCITFRLEVAQEVASIHANRSKPARAKKRMESERLDAYCDALRWHALISLRDFFEQGNQGDEVPNEFQVNLPLNNRCCNFWTPGDRKQ